MTRGAAWTVHLSVIAAGTTGVVYGWMRYFCEPDPEAFTIQNHALEDELQAAHIVLVPLLVFACGLLWRTPVLARPVDLDARNDEYAVVADVRGAPVVVTRRERRHAAAFRQQGLDVRVRSRVHREYRVGRNVTDTVLPMDSS